MRIYMLLAIFIASHIAYAQQSLKGVVLTENKKGKLEAVPFANVYWKDTNIGTSTDSSGTFQIAISEESNVLIGSFVGYQSDTIAVEDFNKIVTLKLNSSVQLEAVEIEYRRKSTEMSFINPIKMEDISEKELFKAACCNLSESFETNPSVDVNFTDAVTGTRQIRMLGLDGPYTLISRENMIGIRGLGNAYGISFIPGSWISSIQVTKGVGSVVNGYESIAGQINVELKKPDEGEQTFLNVYGNRSGRTELNFINTQKLSEKWSTTLMLHGNTRPFEQDRNEDGFMDFPMQNQINVVNRWKFNSGKGLMSQFGVHYVKDEKEGGQTSEKIKDSEAINPMYSAYKVEVNTERVEGFAKIGYVFPEFKFKSFGLQLSAMNHKQESAYGIRSYDANQQTFYANGIYQSIIGTTDHVIKAGLSFMYDGYEEQLDTLSFNRVERVPGVFVEYTFTPSNNITLVAGARVDENNLYGTIYTARMHFRWALDEFTVLRLQAGNGQRTANPIAEKQSVLVSSRSFELLGNANLPYGLKAEKATNLGLNISREFQIDYRDGYVTLDLYRTNFSQQVVLDLDESTRRALFYNLDGESYSNSMQLEVAYELIKFLNLKMAYRWMEVRTDFRSGLRQKPFTPKHRFIANLGYETRTSLKGSNWTFDLTGQWLGEQRVPFTSENSIENQRTETAPSFTLWNTQITRNFNKKWAAYVGVENIFDFRQDNPIVAAENPFGSEFDASMVWGPIFGRMIYGGVRFVLNDKTKK